MNASIVLSVSFLSILAVSLFANDTELVNLLLMNSAVQIVLFVIVACIPFLKTQRMSFVDIAWPFGVAFIGLQILFFGEGDSVKRVIVAAIYLFIGLRMGVGAVVMGLKTGVIFKTEFPRYDYRRTMLNKEGVKSPEKHMMLDILVQGFANMSVLALPGFLIATQSSSSIHGLEIAGLLLFAGAYLVETIADGQKLLFISKNKDGVCNIGLWRYSRHPNYFAEWLVWTGLVVATVPSWLALSSSESTLVGFVMGVGALLASVVMYITLVYLTGAKPAEYYSVQKRAGYKDYQAQTSMFFPWFTSKP